MSCPGERILEGQPRTRADRLCAELLACELIAPVAEGAFRELHDVALVHQRHRDPIVLDGVLDRLADQPLAALLGHRLDADAGARRETDRRDIQLLLQIGDQALYLGGAGRPLDTGVDVLGVLPEHHHVGEACIRHGTGDARKIADRAHAGVQVHALAHRHVEGAQAPADRRAQGTLDRDHVLAQGVQRLIREPLPIGAGSPSRPHTPPSSGCAAPRRTRAQPPHPPRAAWPG